jgi:predicted ATPase
MGEGIRLIRNQVPQFLPLVFELQAEFEIAEGRVENALYVIKEGIAEIEQMAHGAYTAEVHRTRGEILLAQVRPDVPEAEHAFESALKVARCQRAKVFELRAALSLSRLYCATDRAAAIRDLLGPVIVDFEETPEFPELTDARLLLEKSCSL